MSYMGHIKLPISLVIVFVVMVIIAVISETPNTICLHSKYSLKSSLHSFTGTGKLVYSNDLEYLGAFRVPKGDLGDNTTDYDRLGYGGLALAYNPIRNTLLIVGHPYGQRLVEISIPEVINSTNLNDLNTAEVVQNAIDITEGHLAELGENGSEVSYATLGDFLVYNGHLIGCAYSWYDAANQAHRSHFYASLNWSTEGANFHGMYEVGVNPVNPGGANGGFVGGYMTLIPPEWREALGGPALTGLFSVSIISRTSFGPCAWVFDPEKLGVEDPVNATMLVGYPNGHTTIGGWYSSEGSLYHNMVTWGVGGIVFPWGTDSVLFISSTGLSETGRGTRCCYGIGTSNFSQAQEDEYCWDPVNHNKGCHGYPYVYRVWAYDAKDLLKVKEGVINPQTGEPYKPWDIKPYAIWDLYSPFGKENAQIKGVAYDPQTQRIFISEAYGDRYGSEPYPLILVYKVHASNQVIYEGDDEQIRINNNTEFSMIANNMGWPGNGTEDDPYIIEGYEIDAKRDGPGIYIGNTTVHFVIRNNCIFNSSWKKNVFFEGAGILLYNVTNACIENNTLMGNDYGILLLNSYGNVIFRNTITQCYYGVYLGNFSDWNVIFQNSINWSGHTGVFLYGSTNNSIRENIISHSMYDGIALFSSYNISLNKKSRYNILSSNVISESGRYGIYIFYFCSNNLIYNNSFYYNYWSRDKFNELHMQAYDEADNNYWNSSSGIGNYWHDWANNNDTNDQNNDGIVDWPYPIEGSAGAKDYYPLKNPTIVPEISAEIFWIFTILGVLIVGIIRRLQNFFNNFYLL